MNVTILALALGVSLVGARGPGPLATSRTEHGRPAPIAAQPRIAAAPLAARIEQLRADAELGSIDPAWKAFLALRTRFLDRHDPSASAGTGPALIALGRAFLHRGHLEQALDTWATAAKCGDPAAGSYLSAAVRRLGWPLWMRRSTAALFTLPIDQAPEGLSNGLGVVDGIDERRALPPAIDPLERRPYPHSISVYLNAAGSDVLRQRFLIHFTRPGDVAIARRLARDFAVLAAAVDRRLGRSTRFDEDGRVEVWLVTGGAAGGEQWKEHVFFYDLDRRRSNLEWFREAAHEYGHECLPGTGGFTRPEPWADGEIGERVFLRWFMDPSEASTLDALGLHPSGLAAYLDQYARPAVERWEARQGTAALTRAGGTAEMEPVLGLVLWAEQAHGTRFLRKMFDRQRDATPLGPWRAYASAVSAALDGPGLNVSPIGGRDRFYVPRTGRFRLDRTDGRNEPVGLRAEGGRGVRVGPGAAFSAQAGWYTATAAALTLRRVGR